MPEKGNRCKAAHMERTGEIPMEKMLLELLEVNRQILSELRLLRRDLAPQETERPQPAVLESPFPAQAAKAAPARTTAEDLEDIRGALMNGLKLRNKTKSNAFSEFEKRHKDW